jgi:hypothetical protein
MEAIIQEVKEIQKWTERCHKRSDLHDFNTLMNLGVDIGNHLRKLLLICIHTTREDESTDKEILFDLRGGVIVGHLVRIYKLYDQLVYFVAENKGEISQLFYRPMFEAFVTMRYLLLRGNKSIDNFIKVSFQSAMKDYEHIKRFEPTRSLTNIEKRITQSIEAQIRRANLDPIVLARNKNWKLDGLTFKGLLDYLSKNDPDPKEWNMTYSFLYGSSSSFVHGSWHDIEFYHLKKSDGKYSPKVTYGRVDPRFILPQGFIPIMAGKQFLRWRKSDPDNFLTGTFDKLGNLLVFLNEMDELRIEGKGGAT